MEHLAIVRGKRTELVPSGEIRRLAEAAGRVVVDVGAGDGRWLYRMARSRPETLCIGIDAATDALAPVARRAGRRAERGGAPNLVFIRSAAERLPAALDGIAAEVFVHYPWGSLLQAVMGRRPEVLGRLARLLRTGGVLRAVVNLSALSPTPAPGGAPAPGDAPPHLRAALAASYAAAGLRVVRCGVTATPGVTAWGKRLGRGRALPALRLEAERGPGG